MTGCTIRSIFTIVFIFMAGNTTRRQTLINAIPVTGFTRSVAMFPNQWEGCDVVVETRISPALCIMTGAAICSKATTVVVIICMAGIAIHRCALIDPVLVTGITR
jgi:hypothetical protein